MNVDVHWWLCLVCFCSATTARAAEPIRVDLSQDNGRNDVLARNAEHWRFADGDSATQTFRGVTVTLRKAGDVGTGLTGVWWKAGFDFNAALASDGVTVRDGDRGGRIEMTLRGLTPGRHSLVTFHNSVLAEPLSALNISVDGRMRVRGVRPSSRVTDDADAATGFVEFEVRAGQDVRLLFEPDGSAPSNNVVINGFAIDAVDPTCQAQKPRPTDGDEHVAQDPVLTWTPAKNAKEQHIYVGTDFETVAHATQTVKAVAVRSIAAHDSSWAFTARNPLENYFWRVDTVDRDDPTRITRGAVWRFRVRQLAFPGAEGYGRFALGGRGGRVLEVTNLDDRGPGSLRAAVETEGPRTVVFRVGGTIKLGSKLVIRHPYLTVAGQTALGDGICVRGYTFGCLGTHDVVLRHIRIRVGDEAKLTMDGTGFASSDHCIMDHCSISWSIDEAVSSRGAGNITLQRCLVSEALNIADHKKYQPGKGHSFAASISGNVGSFHHNLVAHCAGRNWSLAGGLDRGGKFAGRLDIRNNVIFNWEHRTTDGGVKALNFVNNYYLPGPASRVFHLVKPDAGSAADPQQYFIAGNVMVGRPQFDADNWANSGVVVDPGLIDRIRLEIPFCEPHVTTTSATDAYHSVLADVGANLPALDTMDRRILNEVRQRTATNKGNRSGLPGIIDSQTDAGGWPDLRGGDPPADSDHDGLPDAWETMHGLNLHDATDGSRDPDGDGYTELERYLFEMAVRTSR
jgi:hypothetical protein